jgi:hypothetical protein
MPAYLKQAPTGVPGDVTRTDESNVEPGMLVGVGSPPVYPVAFGIPVKDVAGGFQQYNGGAETAASFAGVLVREVPQQSGSIASDTVYNPTVPNPVQPQGILVRGYVSVLCKYGTPARGGVVYTRIAVGGANPSGAVGDFEATFDSGFNVALSNTQASWATDGTDALYNAELRVAR